MSVCVKCTADTADGIALCGRCRTTAYYALANIRSFYADLDLVPTTVVRRRTSNSPDPTGVAAARIIRDPVAEIDDETVATLTRWATRLPGQPPRAVPDLAPWLTEHLGQVAANDWAADFLHELTSLEKRLRKIAARADTGAYVGACGNQLQPERIHDHATCGCACHLENTAAYACDVPGGCNPDDVVLPAEHCTRPLYAPRDSGWVKCKCGANWDVRARRQQLVRAAEDEVAPVAVIAHLAALWIGEPSVGKVQARLDQWVKRERIKHVTTKVIDRRQRKVYRVGDVLDLLTATPNSNQTRQRV